MKKCKCWRCERYSTCDANKMTDDEIKRLPCIKYVMDSTGLSFEESVEYHFEEVSDEQREAENKAD